MSYSQAEVWKILCTCYLIPVAATQWRLPLLCLDIASSHPTEIVITIYLIPMITALFTAPNSWIRFAVTPMIATLVAAFVQAPTEIELSAKLGAQVVLVLLTSINFLVLQRLYLKKDGEERTIPVGKDLSHDEKKLKTSRAVRSMPKLNALKWAWNTVWNYRAIGTTRQVKNIPHFSTEDENYTPSRADFLMKRVATVLLLFLMLDSLHYIWSMDSTADLSPNGVLFMGISQLSLEDWRTRVFDTLWFWASLRFLLEIAYDIFSIFFVGLMIDSPQDWPPYFGPLSSAYTLRNFWGIYWHQAFRFIGAHADFWTYGVFRQEKGTIVARYLHMFVVFFISGLQHSVHEACVGVPWSDISAYVMFILQVCGIMGEDAVEHLFASSGERKDVATLRTWHKIAGYVWVFAFLVWSSPIWIYAVSRYDNLSVPTNITASAIEKFLALQ